MVRINPQGFQAGQGAGFLSCSRARPTYPSPECVGWRDKRERRWLGQESPSRRRRSWFVDYAPGQDPVSGWIDHHTGEIHIRCSVVRRCARWWPLPTLHLPAGKLQPPVAQKLARHSGSVGWFSHSSRGSGLRLPRRGAWRDRECQR